MNFFIIILWSKKDIITANRVIRAIYVKRQNLYFENINEIRYPLLHRIEEIKLLLGWSPWVFFYREFLWTHWDECIFEFEEICTTRVMRIHLFLCNIVI